MTKGQFLTASYYAEIVMSSKQLKFSTLRKLHDLSKLRQDLLKKYAEIESLGKEKKYTAEELEKFKSKDSPETISVLVNQSKFSDEEIKENQNEFLVEEYTETFNPIYANTIDNLESEELIIESGKNKVELMECLFIMLGNNLIKES